MTDTGQFDAYITAAALKYSVDPKLIKAVIQQESGFNPTAHSSAGAGGLMQLMPGTAAGLGVTNVNNPAQNIDGGTKFLSGLLKQFNGNVSLALAGYNAGAGAVKKYGGIPPYAETQNYVKKILASYNGAGWTASTGVTTAPAGATDTASAGGGFAQDLVGGIIHTIVLIGLLVLAVIFLLKSFDIPIGTPQQILLKTALGGK
jgi:hypothetical protein